MATSMQTRALWKSAALHGVVASVLLLLPAGPPRESAHPEEVDVVFHRPPVPLAALPVVPVAKGGVAIGPRSPQPAPPARAVVPDAQQGTPIAMETPGLPEGPKEVPVAEPPKPEIGKSGILAFKDQIASVATEKNSPRLGASARVSAAADTATSSKLYLLNSIPGGSGGINAAGLTRNVGGGGGGAGGGSPMQGVSIGRETSPLAGIGGSGGMRGGGGAGGAGGSGLGAGMGAGDGTGSHAAPGNARTDEEIQIVFDRNKASFYRLYHRQLRNDPTLKGQMVLRLTIEPDGSVSMCALQSSDMHAPDLASQVVDRVKSINFGAKEGVSALTIVYPIDFLPAA